MKILDNYSLLKNNTFRINVKARFFCVARNLENLSEIRSNPKLNTQPKLFLGAGANILFTKDFSGLVIKNEFSGLMIVSEDNDYVVVEVGGGENWHNLVDWAVKNNWGGIENLALIPGTVGAAIVQNIAAYGQNISDVFDSLEAFDMDSGLIKVFRKKECKLSYRDSYFKTKQGSKYFVFKVRLKLAKKPIINTSYFETGKTYTVKGSLEQELANIAKSPYTIKDIFNAVISIRTKKLPDISKIGTAGSFFKNPVITREKYLQLLKVDPDLQCYPVDKLTYPKLNDPKLTHEDYVKIPGGRLLDNLDWKGRRLGNAGTHITQAMAIVNYGSSNPLDIVKIYKQMQQDVIKHYGIKMEPEVNII